MVVCIVWYKYFEQPENFKETTVTVALRDEMKV